MPTLEEISDDDIDNMDFDPSEFDPRNPFAKNKPSTSLRTASTSQQQPQQQQQPNLPLFPDIPMSIPPGGAGAPGGPKILSNESDLAQFKDWLMLYPVYFDASKSREDGRRISKTKAVENPLAQTLVEAVKSLGLRVMFETMKTHPRDWANPGRVRVSLPKDHPRIKNKRHLFSLVAEYLKSHPTPASPSAQPIAMQQVSAMGMPAPDSTSPLAVPRGWHINSVLPLTSRALSSGQATEEMMRQMQNSMFPGLNMPDMKPKKIKIRAK